MKERVNTIDQPDNQHESTYALLVRSEEKSRNLFEAVIYPLLILGPLIAIWQFAQQPVKIPAAGWKAWVISDACAQNRIGKEELHTLRRAGHREVKG